MSRKWKIVIGLASLAGVLLYNWTHTGGLLAAYVKPEFVGYIAAAGIELAVVGLSLRIDEMRRAQADAKFHLFTLLAVVIVSALANIAQGYLVKFGDDLTTVNIGRLDGVQVVVSLAATGLLSLVVFALAEVVGHDIGASEAQPIATDLQPAGDDCHCPTCNSIIGLPVWLLEQHGDKYIAYCDKCQRAYTESEVAWSPSAKQVGATMKQGQQSATDDAQNDTAAEDRPLESPQMPTGSDLSVSVTESALSTMPTNEAAKTVTFERGPVTTADIILEYYQRNPDATMTQAAQHVARATGTPYSRQAVAAQLQRLEVAGKIARNGHVEVLQ